ncbi:MAG: hypothetical protein GY940_30225 [bacterium]|nr:hypothetical protein [bacterium]
MSRIGEESSEKLEMPPAQLWVSRHIRHHLSNPALQLWQIFAADGKDGTDQLLILLPGFIHRFF